MSGSRPQNVSAFLAQDEWWVNKSGFVSISSMNVDHRRRAAQFLIRRSRLFGMWSLDEELGLGDVPNEVQEFVGRLAAPATFMKQTPLYRRLIQDGADPEAFRGLVDDDD